MSRTAKGTSIEKLLAQFEKVDFDEKVKLFQGIKDYMQKEADKALNDARHKVAEFEKLHESITQ